jgi:hypothetical protein
MPMGSRAVFAEPHRNEYCADGPDGAVRAVTRQGSGIREQKDKERGTRNGNRGPGFRGGTPAGLPKGRTAEAMSRLGGGAWGPDTPTLNAFPV